MDGFCQNGDVSTHSRPKAAGPVHYNVGDEIPVSTHSRPKAAGLRHRVEILQRVFQHTAARRRLVPTICTYGALLTVSTHSRPKAAGKPT